MVHSAVEPAELYTAPRIRRCASCTMRTAPRASIDCTDTEPIIRCRARRRARRRVLIERLHRSLGQSNDCTGATVSRRVVSSQSLISARHVTKSNQSNVVKLEPAAGPTLFLIRTTTDHSTTATASEFSTAPAARRERTPRQGRDLYKGSSIILENKYYGNGKVVHKEILIKVLCKRPYTGHS